MSKITDEEIKEIFPELFKINLEDIEKQQHLLNIREAIRRRLGMDEDHVKEISGKLSFTKNEAFLYAAIIRVGTKENVKKGMTDLRVSILEEEIENLKKVTQHISPLKNVEQSAPSTTSLKKA